MPLGVLALAPNQRLAQGLPCGSSHANMHAMPHADVRRLMPLLLMLLALPGCARYEFAITQPAEMAARLSRQEHEVAREPLVYHFVDQSLRVGIRIENPTDDPITLKGETSYIVTPDGQSQPLRAGTIAPHTWSGFTIPPVQRVYRRSGLSFGFGVGTFGDHSATGIGLGYDPFYDDFAYVPTEQNVWRWKEGTVRLHLVFERGGGSSSAAGDSADATGRPRSTFEHDFEIVRRRVE